MHFGAIGAPDGLKVTPSWIGGTSPDSWIWTGYKFYMCFMYTYVYIYTGWWLSHPSEKYESQSGWWHSQYVGK